MKERIMPKNMWLRLFIFAIASSCKFQINATNSSQTEHLMALIHDGLHVHPAHSMGKAILLVGMTGSGKTTLVKFITGDNSRLVSVGVSGKSKPSPCLIQNQTKTPSDYNDGDEDSVFDCENQEAAKEYFIKDLDDDKIGNDITNSKTFYPEVYIDETTGEVFVDCPGFADTRSDSHEVAIAVLTKNIFKWAKHTKIVLVANYGDVTRTGGRNEIKNLLRFATILLKNYQVFNTSVGFVANKVTNEYSSQQKLISDEGMIEQIAEFLGSVRDELVKQNPDDTKVQLLTSLLQQVGSRYPNIGIFRRTYEEGPLQNIPTIQTGKKKLRKMILKNLKYANLSDSDIGFAISPASEAVVIDLCEKIKDDIDLLLDRLYLDFRGYYDTVVENSKQYQQLSEELAEDNEIFQNGNLNQSATFDEKLDWFVDTLLENKAASHSWVKSTIATIRNQTTYLKFLGELSSSPKVAPKENWKTRINELLQNVERLAEWYQFITSTYNWMAQDDFQSKKADLSFDILNNWSLFKKFIFEDFDLFSDFNNIKNKKSLEKHEQKSLEDVLHMLLEPTVGRASFTSSDTCELEIEGNFIRLSELKELAGLCGDKAITAIYLFAQHTIFIDVSLSEVGSETLIGIVAPKWEVIGSQYISLTGYSGHQNLSISDTGDGDAGLPGGPSGTFFGIGSDFINAESLQIFANGGNGGNGQDGMDGRDGHDGVDPSVVNEKACNLDYYYRTCSLHKDIEFTAKKITYKMHHADCVSCFLCCPEYQVEFTIIDGPKAISGFNGGKSGLGGKGSTNSQIIDLKGDTKVKINKNDGISGTGGKGGQGGLGAYNNDVFNLEVITTCDGFYLYKASQCRPRTYKGKSVLHRFTRPPRAENGTDNFSGIQPLPKPVKSYNIYSIITKYRLFVANQTLWKAKQLDNMVFDFVESIANNEKIQDMTNLYSLIDEFIALDAIRKQNTGSQQWLPFLNLLLQSTETVRQTKTSSDSFAVGTYYLRAAILSRKLSIEYQFDRNLIVDVNLFLKEVSSQIQKLAHLDHGSRFKALKQIFSQDIIMKQQQANVFLNQQFSAEIKLIESKISTTISGLRNDVTNLLAKLESDRHKFIEIIQEVELKIQINKVLKFLEQSAKLISLFGGTAEEIGNILAFDVELVRDYIDKPDAVKPNSEIPLTIETLDGLNRKFDVENQNNIRLLVARVQNWTSSIPKENRVLDKAKTELTELVKSTGQFSIVQRELSLKIENLRRDHSILDSVLLDRVQTSIFLVSETDDVAAYENLHKKIHYSTEVERYTEIEELKQGLKKVEDNIIKVAAYERFVEESFSSFIKNFTIFLISVKDGASQSSAIALEISRYNIQKTLLEVRSIINKYTVGFDANEELIMCIDMLDNLMRTTINVYDQIQKYNDQLNLGSLIVGINEAGGLTGVTTSDTRLNDAIRLLDHKIVINTVQNQYLRVMQAFQQLVFPFASLFLPALQITTIGDESDDDAEIQQITTKIGTLQSKINDLRSSVINGYDEQLYSFNFNEMRPFFAWNERQHEQKIMALLQGDEVTFKAKVVNSVGNAVKFTDIRLNFVATNAIVQNQLDAYLKKADVRLVHAGNSQYKCGDRFYVISHQQQVIEFSAASDERGEPVSSNAVYKKIRDGNILLSPYTLWKVKINNYMSYKGSNGAIDLTQLFGKVQLKLVGKGQFIKENSTICDQSLEQYYQLDQIDE